MEGVVSGSETIDSGLGKLRVANLGPATTGDKVWLALRPEKISVGREQPGDGVNVVAGTVVDVGYRGDMSIYKVRLIDRSLMKAAIANVSARGKGTFEAGDVVWLSWPTDVGVVLTG